MKTVLSLILLFAAAPQIASAQNGNETNSDVIPLIVFDNVSLADAIKNLSRQMGFIYILDPRVPGSSLGPGRYIPQPSVNVRWTNLTARQAFDRVLASNNLVMIKLPGNPIARIAPANPGSRLIAVDKIRIETNEVNVSSFSDWDLIVTLRDLGKRAGMKFSFDPVMSAPALGFYGEMWGWMHSDEVTYQQAIDALLENYGLILIENPTNATARITLNPRDKELSAVNAMNVSRSDGGWRTVNVGFRMTIPADWEKERVVPMDSNCGGFEGETVHLEFDEVYYGMVAGTGTNTPAVIDVLRKKQANPKFLRAGEEIWQLDGRFADFIIGKVEPTSGQAFTNMARLSVPYPDQSGYLAVYLYYQSERDVPILRRILQSIEWKK